MSKIWIIIQREYLTRVRNKTFLLSTFLLPLVMVLFIAGSTFFAIQSREKQRIAVVNDPGYFKANLKSDSNSVIFSFDAGVDSLNYASKGYNGILYLPGNGTEYKLISSKQVGLESKSYIRKQLNKTVESHLLQERGIQKTTLDSISEATDNAVELTNVVLEKTAKPNRRTPDWLTVLDLAVAS